MLSLRTGGELRLSYVSSVHTNSIILRIIHTKRISTKIASVKEIDGVNESKSCLGHVMQLRASNHGFSMNLEYYHSLSSILYGMCNVTLYRVLWEKSLMQCYA